MKHAYSEVYLGEVVENQGKLFDYFAMTFPDKSTSHFIRAYMKSKTRSAIDEAMAYVCTMDSRDLWEYFVRNDMYEPVSGKAMEGFAPDWIGEFYAYYQWYYDIPSALLVDKIPVEYLERAYPGLHDLELELAVKKVGEVAA